MRATATMPSSSEHTRGLRPDADPGQAGDYGDWLVQNLALVQQVILCVCRRQRLAVDEQADFVSTVCLKLIDDDYAVLRRFRGQSSLRTFLFVVVHRFLLDWRNSQWGKWRPSQQARRLGPTAVSLEQLTVRDGLTLDEAIGTLIHRSCGALSSADLRRFDRQLPPRAPRRRPIESPESLEAVAVTAGTTDTRIERLDLQRRAVRVGSALARALASLERDDRQLLRRRFGCGESIADIARALGADQKALYRRFNTILARVRRALESEALTRSDIGPIIGHAEVQLGSIFAQSSALCP